MAIRKKFCTRCSRKKPISRFWRSRRTKDGLQSFCKPCLTEAQEKSKQNRKGCCQHCGRYMVISWDARREVWRLLARKWWDKRLCLECFIELVSYRQRNLVILERKDFLQIVFCARRVRGYLDGRKWPFPGGRRIPLSTCTPLDAERDVLLFPSKEKKKT